MTGIARPEYRVLVPSQQHFDCTSLRAALSTADCAKRWQVAPKGTACAGCALGHVHHADHNTVATSATLQHAYPDNACLRCGRTDLRIIRLHGLCISCANRRAEALRGRNGNGTAPVKFKQPKFELEALFVLPNGKTERRLELGVDVSEALWRLLRKLPAGAKFGEDRRYTAWNAVARQFEHVCQHCGTQGLVLERIRSGCVQRHAWCCLGEPRGAGWQIAPVRLGALALDSESVAALFGSETAPDLARESAGRWVPTGYVCGHCKAGQLEGRQVAPQQPWQVRCRVCGSGTAKNRLTSALTYPYKEKSPLYKA